MVNLGARLWVMQVLLDASGKHGHGCATTGALHLEGAPMAASGQVELTATAEGKLGGSCGPIARSEECGLGSTGGLESRLSGWLHDSRTERSARSAALTVVIYASAYYGKVEAPEPQPPALVP